MSTTARQDKAKQGAVDLKAENKRLEVQFKAQHGLVVAFFTLILIFHAIGIYLFCSGFLLSRLVLEHRSQCAQPPAELLGNHKPGSIETGCWHPKTFDKAVVIVIDALRYDFTIPFKPDNEVTHHFHNALPILYDTSIKEPHNAFLRPFIADPPTTTLQRLKGLTTGSLPTLIDAGSNFAGTAIDEDNLVEQLFNAGKRVVHLGDDTWHALFPGYFEPNLTRAYDSFNVWDLHTVDNGVNEHLFPLLGSDMRDKWDVIFAHYLGVDHAGHRYGPDHPAMGEKLMQMNAVLAEIMAKLDDKTLLVVLGDHGMDVKGDHGGESDDEVEAALWMYSKAGKFGRRDPAYVQPASSAKERPVNQIDLVPTLALLLGIPVPFNNLGQPIEEAFTSSKAQDWHNLASASHITAAQIHKYQAEYATARKLDPQSWLTASTLWSDSQSLLAKVKNSNQRDLAWKEVYNAYTAYQAENLQICKSMWARFDLFSMGMGITVLLGTFLLIAIYAQGIVGDHTALAPLLAGLGFSGSVVGAVTSAAFALVTGSSLLVSCAFGAFLGGGVGLTYALWSNRDIVRLPLPRTVWGFLSAAVCLMLCIGFAANSFTIWEDQQLLFFLTTFAVLMLGSSLGQDDAQDRLLGTLNSVSFLAATRISSLSRLCREEQMPFCRSSYYASATSSTSAAWQLGIPFVVAIVLPTVLANFYHRTRNYQGSAVIWIGIALRIGLAMVAIFWVIDVADDGDWYPSIGKDLLKTVRVFMAQAILAIAFGAGISTYIFASPLIAVKQETVAAEPTSTSKPIDSAEPGGPILTTIDSTPKPRTKLIIMGYANTYGTRSQWVKVRLLCV
ncbi:hypothetical protein AMS68_007329 [Peltaster fructicola]|uniref:Uncharacterized protein n=1 Tax=Peltaster fructicola TaxID=286661 RepID=A0A6H0Y468_9PEZI|nr:hypothetical protein AMS68_007329 [Peltaster fructicola]